MRDIMTYLNNEHRLGQDPNGYLMELEHWSPRVANQLAAADGLVLEEKHWEVIFCLRERYRDQGPDWAAHPVSRALDRDFAALGGRRYLYDLFPKGPLAQGCRIAGLPLPHGTLNASFGSVH